MNDYISVAVATGAVVIVFYGLVRWRLGNSLPTRLFSVMILSIGSIAYIAFVLGKQGVSLFTLSAATIVGVSGIVAKAFGWSLSPPPPNKPPPALKNKPRQ